MTDFDWGAFAAAVKTAEAQFKANAPLPPATETLGVADALRAAQPFVDKASAFVETRPGSVTAALTVLAELRRQSVGWAADLEEIVSAAAGALPKASADLAEAINLISEFSPAPQPMGGGDSPASGRR